MSRLLSAPNNLPLVLPCHLVPMPANPGKPCTICNNVEEKDPQHGLLRGGGHRALCTCFAKTWAVLDQAFA